MTTTRQDGRLPHETRALTITYEGLARVDGSARFGFGSPQSLSSLAGPIEVRLASELPSSATFEVIVRPLSGVPGTESKSLAAAVRSALLPGLLLNRNPRTLVQVVVQSLVTPLKGYAYGGSKAGGGGEEVVARDALTASTINSTTLALLNASSVPMRGVVCAVPIAILRIASHTPSLLVDPSPEELSASQILASGCFAFLFASHLNPHPTDDISSECVWTTWRILPAPGSLSPVGEEDFQKARKLALTAASAVYIGFRESVANMGTPTTFKWEDKAATLDTGGDATKRGEKESREEIDDDKMEI